MYVYIIHVRINKTHPIFYTEYVVHTVYLCRHTFFEPDVICRVLELTEGSRVAASHLPVNSSEISEMSWFEGLQIDPKYDCLILLVYCGVDQQHHTKAYPTLSDFGSKLKINVRPIFWRRDEVGKSNMTIPKLPESADPKYVNKNKKKVLLSTRAEA